MLTGFDYARPEDPRSNSVLDRLAEVLDPAYVAPECQNRPQAMSRASDVYAAGVIAYQVLTGELPFASSTDQYQRASALPPARWRRLGLPQPLIDLLQRMCAQAPEARPSAAEAAGGAWPPRAASARLPAPRARGMDYRNLPEGYQLTRKYTVQRKIGGGSFGVVYQVYDNLADADRAVKIVDRDRDSLVERPRAGVPASCCALPPHPNVVRVENADYLDGRDVPYLVFEYLDGKDVSDLVKDRALGPADTVRLGIDVATGLAFLHANGVYHCDIKPSNLLWTDQRLQDHRLQRGRAVVVQPVPGRRLGPIRAARRQPRRAAERSRPGGPRRVRARRDAVPGADRPVPVPLRRPALGEVAADPRTIAEFSELSDALVDTLLRAIAPLRGDRYGSAEEFLAALKAIGEVHRKPAPPPPAPDTGARRAERQPVRRSPAVPLQPVPGQQRGHPGRGRVRHLRGDGARRAPDPGRARRRATGWSSSPATRVTARPPSLSGSSPTAAASAAASGASRGPTGRTCGCRTAAGCAPTTTAARTRATGPTTTCCSSSSRPFADGASAGPGARPG